MWAFLVILNHFFLPGNHLEKVLRCVVTREVFIKGSQKYSVHFEGVQKFLSAKKSIIRINTPSSYPVKKMTDPLVGGAGEG